MPAYAGSCVSCGYQQQAQLLSNSRWLSSCNASSNPRCHCAVVGVNAVVNLLDVIRGTVRNIGRVQRALVARGRGGVGHCSACTVLLAHYDLEGTAKGPASYPCYSLRQVTRSVPTVGAGACNYPASISHEQVLAYACDSGYPVVCHSSHSGVTTSLHMVKEHLVRLVVDESKGQRATYRLSSTAG